MAEGTNEFLKEIDQLLGEEAPETDAKHEPRSEAAGEPYVRPSRLHVELQMLFSQ